MHDVPQIVVKRLQGMAVTDPHPEAELLTAFAEQSLAQSERELVLGHLARCAECRQIIELALPVTETETVISTVAFQPHWLSWPALRWGFATAVILVLVSIGALDYEHWHKDEMASVFSLHGQLTAKQGASSSVQPEAATPSQARAQLPNSTPGNRGAVVHLQAAPTKGDFQTAAGAGTSDAQRMRSEANAALMARNRAPNEIVQNEAPAESQYQSYTSSDVVKAKAAVTAQASAESAPAFAPPNIPLQTSPSLMQRASPRWTITAAGGLQRSFDAGKTWQDVNVSAEAGHAQKKVVFRAVSAIGPEVWAGGSGAMLYHSSDSGTRWQQVFPFSTGARPVGDITDIQFSTPQAGKITTSAGEIWTTSDNGQTWQKQ